MPLIAPAAIWLNEVAKAGSIRGAASRLNLSPSAVNRQILNLEAEYGTQLFERLARGVRLTAAGEVLVAEVRRWLHDQEKARRHLNELRGTVRGHTAIGLMESISRQTVSRLMTFMRERRSLVSLDVTIGGTSMIIDQLVAGTLELAICYAVPKRNDIEVLASVGPSPGIVVAKGHPLAAHKSLRLADCRDYPFVLPDHSLTVRRTLDAAFEEAQVVPRVIVTTNSIEVIKMLVHEHGQVAMLGLADVYHEVVEGKLVHIPFRDHFVTGSHLSLVAAKRARLSPMAQLVAEKLRDFLNELPAP